MTQQEVFNTLKTLLKEYEPPFTSKVDSDKAYDLWSIKDLVIADRPRNEVYFAGIVMQKEYVGFYYMPTYADTDLKEIFKSELLQILKGKSCFHIKSLNQTLLAQIKEALAIGFRQYQERDWV